MDRFSILNVPREVAGILNDSRKLFLKNKKLMFSALVFPLFLNCLVYLFNTFAIQPEIKDLILESSLLPMTDPSSPEFAARLMRVSADVRRLFVSLYIFFAVSFIINLLSTLVIVHASALTHRDDNIKIKDFPVLTLKSWKGPLVTNFYIVLFSLGYWFLYIILFSLPLFSTTLFSTITDSVAAKLYLVIVLGILFAIFGILFAIFGIYLAIVCNLSMVISILEETYGIEALGKAAKIVKGMKPKLFLLNLFFGLGGLVSLTNSTPSFGVTLTTGLVVVIMSLISAVRMFQLVTYTVVYFQCTRLQEQDVESLRDVKYTKLRS